MVNGKYYLIARMWVTLFYCNLKFIHHSTTEITDGETEARIRKDDGGQDTRGQRRGNLSHDLRNLWNYLKKVGSKWTNKIHQSYLLTFQALAIAREEIAAVQDSERAKFVAAMEEKKKVEFMLAMVKPLLKTFFLLATYILRHSS